MIRIRKLKPAHLWLFLFAAWALLLSGVFGGFMGSPGVIQALRLKGLLQIKHRQIAELEDNLKRLENERLKLEKSKVTQEREIRRILGYAASDEIIFDFAAVERR